MTPTHASSPCLEQGCFRLATSKGRCAECNLIKGGDRVGYDQRRGSPRERGYGRKWERRRRWHLEAEPFCRVCGVLGNQVDHVVPHRGETWLFELRGNLQTLCEKHHQNKTAAERSIPIGMMYPLDLPDPPHARPTELYCGPNVVGKAEEEGFARKPHVIILDDGQTGLMGRNRLLGAGLELETKHPLVLITPAPRTAQRAFWSYVMDCEAELVEDVDRAIDGGPWWNDYMLDQRAEEAIRRRVG